MSWIRKTAIVTGVVVGITAGTVGTLTVSHRSEAAIAVIDQKNIEEAIKTAIQTANILTEEQKQLALQILNMKKLDVNKLADLLGRNTQREQAILAGDAVLPPGILGDKDKSVEAVWDERMGNIEDVINGNITVVDMTLQEQNRQKALHETAKGTAEVAKQTMTIDKQSMTDAQKALEASNEAEGQQQPIQAGNYLLYDILGSVVNGNRSKAHMAASMAAYFDAQVQEKAESDRILSNSTSISKKWVENMQ